MGFLSWLPDWTADEWAQVLSAVFTAGAAVAAWAAVSQTRRVWTASQTPDVTVEVIQTLPAGEIRLHVENVGGAAKKVQYTLVEGASACIGYLPPTSFLKSGEGRTLKTTLAPAKDDTGIAVVTAWDLAGRYLHAWSANGRHKRWRRSQWRKDEMTAEKIFLDFYPDTPSPAALTLGQAQLESTTGA